MRYRSRLYWTCLKDTSHVFKTAYGKIPFKCPFCDSRKIRGCTKDWYDTILRSHKYVEVFGSDFEQYQKNSGDYNQGAYGRYVWGSVFGSS